ncbi:MAG: GxxExxY protein [Terrimonas sp.]|nr:GxxExxY protein [Terrimonas sp.]
MNIEQLNYFSKEIIDACFKVHKELGPGLLESVYDICLAKELSLKAMNYQRQVMLPVVYKGEELSLDFRIDFIIENEIIVELKAMECILPVHEAQLLTYLKLSQKRLGLLINFNVPLLKNGIKRMIL